MGSFLLFIIELYSLEIIVNAAIYIKAKGLSNRISPIILQKLSKVIIIKEQVKLT